MIKDAHELELMQLASTATLKVYAAVHRALRPGMTQVDVEAADRHGLPTIGFEAKRACRSANTRRYPTAR